LLVFYSSLILICSFTCVLRFILFHIFMVVHLPLLCVGFH
jgi:hypothetical protein